MKRTTVTRILMMRIEVSTIPRMMMKRTTGITILMTVTTDMAMIPRGRMKRTTDAMIPKRM